MQPESKIIIAVGKSRLDTEWVNRPLTWETIVKRCEAVVRTKETYADFKAMSKTQRGKVKDKGGFVGGELIANGQRKSNTIKNRTLLTLDIDYGREDTIKVISDAEYGYAWFLYSTHSHSSRTPRYRLVMPLSRPVTPDEYIPIARHIASVIGIDLFDDSTYEPSRLMYWPTCSVDADFVFEQRIGKPVDADMVLSQYADWRNALEWPVSSRIQKLSNNDRSKKQEDPTEKGGVVGAFCKMYSISEAIAAFLSDKYTEAGPSRYTYTEGSTEAGLVVYDDKFAYSHHGTDPVCGKEVNAFDLVRLHKFADLDEDTDPDTPINRKPSFAAMSDFAANVPEVAQLLTAERLKAASNDFDALLDAVGQEDSEGKKVMPDWMKLIRWDNPDPKKRMFWQCCPYNLELIMRNDPRIKDLTVYDVFEDKHILLRDLPWAKITPEHRHWVDSDDLGLLSFISTNYDMIRSLAKQTVLDTHDLLMSQNTCHPVRDYLSGLEWDGIPRLDTMLVDYLGAEDNKLTRAMTRKHFTAAVARIFQPGIKYDYVLTLQGPEGMGKSTIIKAMGGKWFNDSFSSGDVGSKDAMEQLRGSFLIELGELKDYKKNTVEAFKAFISKQEDTYRPAYGRKTVTVPRQCVFFATTNEKNFLKGDTGNRRFWPVEVGVHKPTEDVFAITQDEIDQIWAEAVHFYREKEPLFLPNDLEAQSRSRQEGFNEIEADERVGMIAAYLARKVPAAWYTYTRKQRADWFKNNAGTDLGNEGIRREYVCALEVAIECLDKPNMTRYELREVSQILRILLGHSPAKPALKGDPEYGVQRYYKVTENSLNT